MHQTFEQIKYAYLLNGKFHKLKEITLSFQVGAVSFQVWCKKSIRDDT